MFRKDYKSLAIIAAVLTTATTAVALALTGYSREVQSKQAKALAAASSEAYETEQYIGLGEADFQSISSGVMGAQSVAQKKQKLTLLLSSLDHDIRMMVVDENGNLVKNQDFHVFITGDNETGEYQDSDMDGVIYAGNLPSGKYSVRLEALEGFNVPKSQTVKVRNRITYNTIADITALIRSEADIDASKEDTADIGESDDGSLLESGEIDLSSGTIGIDVSKYNKDIDWEKVKASGIEFAIIRLGYRGSSTGVLVEDPYFEKNFAGAKAAGVKTGVYFFTQALNEQEAIEEAEMVAAFVEPSELSTPVFLDVETAHGRGDLISADQRTANINAFCKALEEKGYKAGVYANKTWFNKYINTDALDGWKIWLAQYKVKSPTWKGHYDAWQYSSKGHVDGISGYVDLDLNLSLN